MGYKKKHIKAPTVTYLENDCDSLRYVVTNLSNPMLEDYEKDLKCDKKVSQNLKTSQKTSQKKMNYEPQMRLYKRAYDSMRRK